MIRNKKQEKHSMRLLLGTTLLVVLQFVLVLSVKAQVIGADEARTLAENFLNEPMEGSAMHKMPRKNNNLSAPFTILKNGLPAIYIFNRENGGYVIVSGELGTEHQILAWSESGKYDENDIPVQMKDILENYAEGIARWRMASIVEREAVERNIKLDAAKRNACRRAPEVMPREVNPLLGDINWDQEDPFNLMCPTYKDGIKTFHYVTGCVATAIAQVMKYHEWPLQGRGYHRYTWNGKVRDADFSQSTYEWDLMKPNYKNGTGTEAEKNAVALLMHDLGVAMEMRYEVEGSFSKVHAENMVKFFDYDKNIRYLNHDYCSVKDWEDVLREELAEGRPVLCAGTGDLGSHAFVCDGYNYLDYFHYNFGWGGKSNGWYKSSATKFDSRADLHYGIQKNQGGMGLPTLIQTNDFVWVEDDKLTGKLRVRCMTLDLENDVADFELALAVQNVKTGNVTYYSQTKETVAELNLKEYRFDEDLPDGQYFVYPVARMNDGEWYTFHHNPNYQGVVDLTVTKGVKRWANNNMIDFVDKGVTTISNIYYLLDEKTSFATVTRRNPRGNSYRGYVEIPDHVIYHDKYYTVTEIGEAAFEKCDHLRTVYIGKNINIIGQAAFYDSSLEDVIFDPECEVLDIDKWAFSDCKFKEFDIPETTEYIGHCAFQTCMNLEKVTIPSSVRLIEDMAFNMSTNLKYVHVNWQSLDKVECDENAFSDIETSGVVLYVPKGKVDMYKKKSPWSNFYIVEEGTVDIESVTTNIEEQPKYNLMGHKVKNMLQGHMYIVGGKKVVIK